MRIKITAEDRLFSEYIRKKSGGICSVCKIEKGWKNLQASHYISRRHKFIRWDEDNVSAQCFSCHMAFHENPHEHHRWKKNQLGEKRYSALIERSQVLAVGVHKITKSKLKELRVALRDKLSELDNPYK